MEISFFDVWLVSGIVSVGLLLFVKKKRPMLLFDAVPVIDWRVEFAFMCLFFVFGLFIVPFVLLYLFWSNGRTLKKLVQIRWYRFKNRKNVGGKL